MCKEGIRMGRRTALNTVTVAGVTQPAAFSLAARNDRLTLHFVYVSAPNDPGTGSLIIRNGADPNSLALGFISFFTPNLSLTVETHGQLVTGEVWVFRNGTATSVCVTEVFFEQTLDEVAKP